MSEIKEENREDSADTDGEGKSLYRCVEPGCGKVFSRAEHLSRHKMNHNPKVIYKCHYEDCPKTFVRNDLLKRHLKRHEVRSQKIMNHDFKDIRKLGGERNYKRKKLDKYFMVGENLDDLKEKNIRVVQQSEEGRDDENIKVYKSQNRGSSSSFDFGLKNTSPALANSGSPPVPELSYMRVGPATSAVRQKPSVPATPQDMNMVAGTTSAALTPSNKLLDWVFQNEASGAFPESARQSPRLPQAQLDSTGLDTSSTIVPRLGQQEQQEQLAQQEQAPELENLFLNNVQNFNIESIFLDSELNQQGDPELQVSPNSLLLNMFNDPTLFPHNGSGTYHQYKSKLIKIDEFIYTDMIKLIPALAKNADFTISNIEDLLESYWRFFHPFLPFLHKPSFSTVDTPVLLLFAMIMVGTRFVKCTYYNTKNGRTESINSKFKNASRLGVMIAEPLRWLIFSSKEFTPPSTLWIFQGLVMLEFFEKEASSRVLHERSHLHHGTIIQLLRRSPSLGGNPIKLDNKSTAELTNHDIWKRWVNIESMKRVTFAVFYLDVVDAVMYGHQVMVFAHQIQLPLPCDDDLWENMKVNNDENGTIVPKQPLFLDSLKMMLNGEKVSTTNFGKEILLAGILSVLFQAQQREMQITYGLEAQQQNRNWREAISKALSIWHTDVAGTCCNTLVAGHSHNSMDDIAASPAYSDHAHPKAHHTPTSTASVYSSDELDDSNIMIPQYSRKDTTCKHTAYHIAHLYMRIPHYDFIIMAGAPYWMNVRPSNNDRIAIRNRMAAFFKTKDAKIAALQCYLLLWEVFLNPQDDPKQPDGHVNYSAVDDPFNRSAMIGMCLLFLWDYNYLTEGLENTTLQFQQNKTIDEIVEQENGISHLIRIRNELCRLSDNELLQTHYIRRSGVDQHRIMLKYSQNLNKVRNKQLMVGLLKMVAEVFKYSEYELTREDGRLLRHCARRSCGDSVEICETMYQPRDSD